MEYGRFAIYFVPPEGVLASFGASWLGWDVVGGATVTQPDLPGLNAITTGARRYGFHATLKPPFRLVDGHDIDGLKDAVATLARSCASAQCDGLELARMGRFLALTPAGDPAELSRVAATCVRGVDRFRAPADAVELERRRKRGLSERQDAMLLRWGYPYVMDDFRFHMSLTGRLPKDHIAHWTGILQARLPALPAPFILDVVALVGERVDGRFEVIERFTLTG